MRKAFASLVVMGAVIYIVGAPFAIYGMVTTEFKWMIISGVGLAVMTASFLVLVGWYFAEDHVERQREAEAALDAATLRNMWNDEAAKLWNELADGLWPLPDDWEERL